MASGERRSATLPISRSSEWLSSYDDVWEDGTGVEHVDGAQPQAIDYYYLPDDCLMPPADAVAVEEEAAVGDVVLGEEAAVDTATFPEEWFGQKRRRVEEDEHISQEEQPQEERANPNHTQDALMTVRAAARLISFSSSPMPVPPVSSPSERVLWCVR